MGNINNEAVKAKENIKLLNHFIKKYNNMLLTIGSKFLANQEGGVGKTTTVVNISTSLSR